MMYEFHRKQNAEQPDSVHATYLLTGTRRVEKPHPTNGTTEEDEDTKMKSSQPLASSPARKPDDDVDMEDRPTFVRCVMLVKDNELEQARAAFEVLSSIHIYSLGTSTPKNLQILSDCNLKVNAEHASEDPLEAWKQYGTIHNPEASRRTLMNDISSSATPPDTKAKASTAGLKKETASANGDSRPSSSRSTPAPETKKEVKKPATKAAAPKSQASSIFKSFSKAAAKPEKQESQSSAEASPAPTAAAAVKEGSKADEVMTGFSDDDDDDDDEEDMPTTAATKKVGSGKSKKEREAELQAMMDVEEETKVEKEAGGEDEDEQMVDSQDVEGGAIDKPVSKEASPQADTVTVENGRRRGKRRVMKKKTVKDEEGYLGMIIPLADMFTSYHTNIEIY